MRTCGVVEVAVLGMGDGSIAEIKDLKETSLLFAIEGLKKPGTFVTATKQLRLPGRTLTDRLTHKNATDVERVAQRTNGYGTAVQDCPIGCTVVADAAGMVPPDPPC